MLAEYLSQHDRSTLIERPSACDAKYGKWNLPFRAQLLLGNNGSQVDRSLLLVRRIRVCLFLSFGREFISMGPAADRR